MDYSDYAAHDAVGLAELVAAGDVSAGELLGAAQGRAAAVNPRLNAIIRDMPDEAAARVGEPLSGPFAGVPFLIKDLSQDYAGLPTSWGCRGLSQLPVPEHATVVQRWLDAGLVIFGKTNTPEFGATAVTEPELFGPTRNPWDLRRTPGGSSGGTASAVAAGIVPVGGASDGGGSIRIPAACCGLFGLKPGRGLVPSGPGSSEGMQGAAVEGVISRSVRDSAAMLDVLAGADPVAPYLPGMPDVTFLEASQAEPGRLRIGLAVASAVNPTPHADAIAAAEDAARLLESLGHEVEAVPAPVDELAAARDFLTTWFVSAARGVEQVREVSGCGPEGFEQDTLLMAALGRAVSGVDHLAAIERRHDYTRALATFHTGYDLLLTPTLARPPLRVGALDVPAPLRLGAAALLKTRTTRVLPHLGVVDSIVQDNLGWVPYTQLANITGRPAVSVPLFWTGAGMPLGVQLVGRPGSEGLLLALGAQLEQARPWKDRRPVL
ncbi:6-aminohexanoate-cyclic-dimer hydrolase [Paraconexibacter sp. AEG42_29]|uniref:6-aminohexanoate-cyclic-dimer hydrolase n=1 Tax=Paraconexibacter sp. AEG42_29 TaxID=2997339 RepID=A0AAU7B1S6_9ACTN